MIVIRLRIGDICRIGTSNVDDVFVHHLIEGHIVANHADNSCNRIGHINVH